MRKRALIAAAAALAFCAGEADAGAATGALQLPGAASTIFTAGALDREVGYAIAGAGDVNGDGIGDALLGVPGASHNRRDGSGSAYVVFGSSPLEPRILIASLGQRGFRIDGAPPLMKIQTPGDGGPLTDGAGFSVAAAGDVNGDGLGDVAVGAPGASADKRGNSGSVFVVYGKKTSTRVDLKRLGTAGYRIDGPRADAQAGTEVAFAGDVNGDGTGDLLVGTWARVLGGDGAVYVVFGRARSAAVDLAHLRENGIEFPRGKLETGPWLDGLGDVSGDELSDVVIGAPASPARRAGKAFVVYGRAAPGKVLLGALDRAAGYAITGGPEAGTAVSGPGDVNGDGRRDVLVGTSEGVSHVVFSDGSGAPVDLRDPATKSRELVVTGGLEVNALGSGDANGDGLADVLLGNWFATPGCHEGSGYAAVVYGRRQAGRASVASLGTGGYRIDGATVFEAAGSSVAWAGDVDGDGGSDLLVGAEGFYPSGRAYLVSGRRAAVPARPRPVCARMTVPFQRLGAVLRTRRLRVILDWRSYGPVYASAYVRGLGRVAYGLADFRRPGKRRITLRLTHKAKRKLARRSRVRLRLVLDAENSGILARRFVVLHR